MERAPVRRPNVQAAELGRDCLPEVDRLGAPGGSGGEAIEAVTDLGADLETARR